MAPKLSVAVFAMMLASSAYAQSVSGNGKKDRGKQSQGPPTMSCEQMVANSHGSITLEACKQMMGMQQSFDAAASDPSASRPGDDKMTCDQIVAEMKQLPLAPPDQAKVTEAQVATTDFKETAERQQKEATALAVKESAEESLLTRLAPVNAVEAAETKRIQAEQKAQNERMAKESTPKAERMFNAAGSLMDDVGKQMSANPRMAKLYQMATQKQCKIH